MWKAHNHIFPGGLLQFSWAFPLSSFIQIDGSLLFDLDFFIVIKEK